MKVRYIGKPKRFGSGCRKCSNNTSSSIGDTHIIDGQTYQKGKTYVIDQETGVYLIMTGLFQEVK
ncbi:hypothetical protein [Enterococcus avium]|uniref:hypothetical protein n=1 Tax=Enterococcus avium TaxID=33945 RepID=UPI001F5A651A|nr:hypothetical protein [Enterococcus avium]